MSANTGFKYGPAQDDLADLLVSRSIFSKGNLLVWNRLQAGDYNDVTRSSPVLVGANFTKVASCQLDPGYSPIWFGIRNNGSLWTAGLDIFGYGSLGTNTIIARSSPTQIGSVLTWTDVDTNGVVSLAIRDGQLYGWGYNASGSVGDGTTINKSSPTIIGSANWWKKVKNASTVISFGFTSDGSLYAWGENISGALGDNTTINKSSPVQIAGTWIDVDVISSGTNATTYGIKSNRTLWRWGYDNVGSPPDKRSSPVQIGSDSDWHSLSGSRYHLFLLKTDGTLWMIGNNLVPFASDAYRIFYDAPVQTFSSPIQISSSTNWKNIYATKGTDFNHGGTLLATKTDGTLWGWGEVNHKDGLTFIPTTEPIISSGYSYYYQYYSSPVQISDISSPSAKFKSISGSSALLIEDDNSVYNLTDTYPTVQAFGVGPGPGGPGPDGY